MSIGNHKTRFLALLLSALMAVGSGEGLLTAAAAELAEPSAEIVTADAVPVEELTEAEAAEEAVFVVDSSEEDAAEAVFVEDSLMEEAPVAKTAAPVVKEESTPAPAPVNEAKEAAPAVNNALTKGTVSGFAFTEEMTELTVYAADRTPEEMLVEKMPATISVYLGQSETPFDLPVSWYCVTGDYESGEQSYFQFSPKWDTKAYPLAKGLDAEIDAPCVGVFVKADEDMSTLSVTKSGNESTIYRFLIKNMGLNCAAACGILANIQCECGFNPNVVGHGSASFHGLCQWGLGGCTGNRWSKLQKWCKSKGYSYKSVTGQLMYMKYELETVSHYGYASLKKVSNTASGANKAARIFAKNFEGCSSRYFGTRQRLAQTKYWPEYSPLALAKVTLAEPELYYDGTPQQPELIVTRGTTVLAQDKDYKVSYANNILADLGTFEITGLGKYSGLLLGSFRIKIKNQSPFVTSAQDTPTGIKVTWNPVAGAVRYRVYRKIVGESWVRVGDTAGLSLLDTKAVSGTLNTYTVRCISNDGQVVSDYDSQGLGTNYTAAPALTANGSAEGIRLKWNPVEGAASYRIMRMNAEGEWEELLTTAATAFTDKTAPMGKTSSYQAVSLSEEGEELSCYSVVQSLRLLPIPVLKKAKSVYKGIQVSWKKVPGAVKYRIYRKKGTKWVRIADTKSTSYKDTSVKRKKNYTYTVVCLGKDGKTIESGYSVKGVTGKRKK